MTRSADKPASEFALIQLIPNMLTIAGLCAGMTAIRFGVQGDFRLAVQLILVACVLDGLDGRIARLMKSGSKMGAELDSLADFVNFGVAPPLVIYYWALQDSRNLAWISVLVYTVCCVLRLARFNVSNDAKNENGQNTPNAFFAGVPSPAGALLVLLPMSASFAFDGVPMPPDLAISAYMVAIGLLMISRTPIWSFKTNRVSRENVKFFLVGFAVVGAAALTYAWITLVMLGIGYIAMIIWCGIANRRTNHGKRG
ncbi:CDP-diacylglycerol---serine O-phosphatidyltransferase [Aliiroseovarius sediminilitoris]|uniref:CDP-diacylglycerol--serine O-phosphatidyltransferase n=1 Tax=Aliiroseovarius sediminilitoris TaxID=1173584 RepID=A0A1I0R696_9RHOB|nr:CDP-diacylglycerol---serine O-phosphatidyltransferase [Aliiroseovarius sediminilitoris]